MDYSSERKLYSHTSFYCTLIYYALHILLFFYDLKICGNLALSKSTGSIIPVLFAHFLSISHFLNSHSISDFFIFTVFVMMISD